uniref:Major facilitator superfamily (MFS) profile domain-containing protein n=1 Tax=Heliothis virescens TaxID=7102 RepID=A0A2A4K454_HELVI
MLISSGGWTCYFIMGITFGASTVFIPQIRQEANSHDAVSDSMASWIPAIAVYSGLPWVFILPAAMKCFGRKYTYTFVSISNLISFGLFYFSTSILHIIMSLIINGINTGSHFTVSVMIITEYTSPKHRGFFLTVKSASIFWGIFMANAIGTFFHWKYIGLAGIFLSVYGLIVAYILPESPFWLATKRRFEQCSSSHRWLRGEEKQSEADLEKLILFHKNLSVKEDSKNFELNGVVNKYYNVMTSKKFYKPLLLCLLVQSLYVFSGKVVFSVYALDIISKITAGYKLSPYTAMLMLDGVTVSCMYVGCFFVKLLSRRTLLIGSSLVGIAFLFMISLYAFLIKLSLLAENNYVAIILLVGYSIGISCGPVILTQTISGELVSIESRGLSSCCIDLCLKILLGTILKISPYMFKSWEAHGAFFFYGVSTSIFLVLIFIYLPETKDKSLQEIAEWMEGSKKPVLHEEVKFLPVDGKNRKIEPILS